VEELGAGRLVAGRYRLVEWLGAGGMGTVWRARDEVLQVDVAVKEIRFPAELAGAERAGQVEAAMREARTAALLRGNPHVVTVHDAVAHDGLPWIVMDYVPADTLAATVERDGPLPVARAAEIGLAVLDALIAGRDLGVLHRDVKPSNILLARNGRVLLTDFGIATHVSDPTLTGGGASGGTPAYMAPERLVGGAATLAGDLFSLGATLYLAVEGVAPFARETVPLTIGAVVHGQPPPSTLAGPLAPAIAGLLAKSPADRLKAEGALALLRWALPAVPRPAGPRADLSRRLRPAPAGGPFPDESWTAWPARPALAAPRPPSASASLPAASPLPASLPPGSLPSVPAPPISPPWASLSPAVSPGGGRGGEPAVPVSLAAVASAGVPAGPPPRGRRLAMGLAVALGGAAVVVGALHLLAGGGAGGGAAHASRRPAAALPAGMVGHWQGTVRQGETTFLLELGLHAGRVGEVVGTSRNPAYGCAGEMSLVAVDGATVRVADRPTAAALPCLVGGEDVVVLRPDDTLDYSYPATELSTAGQAILRRVPG